MTEDQRAEWRRILAARAKASRSRRGRRRRRLTTVAATGTVRISHETGGDGRQPYRMRTVTRT